MGFALDDMFCSFRKGIRSRYWPYFYSAFFYRDSVVFCGASESNPRRPVEKQKGSLECFNHTTVD